MVAKATGLRQHEARQVVDRMLEELVGFLQRGETVELRGWGTFEALQVEGRVGRDWKRGTTVQLPSMRRVTFRPGRSLKPKKTPEKVVDRRGQVMLFGGEAVTSTPSKTGRRKRLVQSSDREKP
jgi:nucleoid DNA-binding protein